MRASMGCWGSQVRILPPRPKSKGYAALFEAALTDPIGVMPHLNAPLITRLWCDSRSRGNSSRFS